MSDKVIKAIVCPGCGELSKAEIHTSINPARDKTIRKRVLDGELFDFRCPSCGYTAKLNYPLLYNDMKNRFMVYLIPKIDRFQLCDNELENKYSNLRNINKRIVPTFNAPVRRVRPPRRGPARRRRRRGSRVRCRGPPARPTRVAARPRDRRSRGRSGDPRGSTRRWSNWSRSGRRR